MLRRAAHSIIFLGADRTDRVDLGPAPEFKVLAQVHLAATDTDELTVRLEKALAPVRGSNGRSKSGPKGAAAGAKIGRRVWILWERAGTQTLDMSAGVVDGLDREQLHDSLSFEAEPLTGLPAADSAIDGVLQRIGGRGGGANGGDHHGDHNGDDHNSDHHNGADFGDGDYAGGGSDFRRFWITQTPSSVLEEWQELLTPLGAKLAGVAHPGGLPRERWSEAARPGTIATTRSGVAKLRSERRKSDPIPVLAGDFADSPDSADQTLSAEDLVLSPSDSADLAISPFIEERKWRRIEVWEEVTFVLDGKADGSIETRLVRARPGSERWPEDLVIDNPIAWLGPIPSARLGPGGQVVAVLSSNGTPLQPNRIEFPKNRVPIDWLRAWAAELTAKPRRVPVIEPRSNLSPDLKYYLAGGLVTSMVLAVCIAHGLMTSNRVDALKARADQLETQRAQFAPKVDPKAAQHEAELNDQIAQLQPTVDDLVKQEANLRSTVDQAEKRAADAKTREERLAGLRAAHRPAVQLLITALNNTELHQDPAALVFKEIRQDNSGVMLLTGLCRDSGLADNFATSLASQLAQGGWQVGAAQKRLRDDDIGFDFTIAITPGVLTGVPLPALVNDQTGPTTAPAKPTPADLAAIRQALGGHGS